MAEKNINHSIKILVTDVETKGKRQGYERAAGEYEKIFSEIRDEYHKLNNMLKTKKIYETKKAFYNRVSIELSENLDELSKQKEELKKEILSKRKYIAQVYQLPFNVINSVCASGTILIGGVSLFLMIFHYKEKKLLKAEQKGYEEAKALFKEKIEIERQKLRDLKNECDLKTREQMSRIVDMLDKIIEERIEIAELNVLLK